jgi:glycerol-3-phosphate acyltransferase PlsX
LVAEDLTVSVDAMGGDSGPGVVVAALARSAVRQPAVRFLLHGDVAQL